MTCDRRIVRTGAQLQMCNHAHIFAETILNFWFGAAGGWDRASMPPADVEARWWNGGEALDAELTRRYQPHVIAAATLFENEKQHAVTLPPNQLTDAQRRLLDAERASADRGVPSATELGLCPMKSASMAGSDGGTQEPSQVIRELARSFLQYDPATSPGQINVRHRLALVILLDQFSRNIYRGGPLAFAFDRFTCPLVTQLLDCEGAIAKENTEKLAPFELYFLLMPLEHSEVSSEQEVGVKLTRTLVEQAKTSEGELGESPTTKYLLDALYAKAGRAELVKHFGRYPPRNEVLGRESTAAELRYLEARRKAMAKGAAEGKDQSNYIHLPYAHSTIRSKI